MPLNNLESGSLCFRKMITELPSRDYVERFGVEEQASRLQEPEYLPEQPGRIRDLVNDEYRTGNIDRAIIPGRQSD